MAVAETPEARPDNRTRVLAVTPPVEVRVAEVGGTLELVNHTGVVVAYRLVRGRDS